MSRYRFVNFQISGKMSKSPSLTIDTSRDVLRNSSQQLKLSQKSSISLQVSTIATNRISIDINQFKMKSLSTTPHQPDSSVSSRPTSQPDIRVMLTNRQQYQQSSEYVSSSKFNETHNVSKVMTLLISAAAVIMIVLCVFLSKFTTNKSNIDRVKKKNVLNSHHECRHSEAYPGRNLLNNRCEAILTQIIHL